jgi:hypothetical protein
MRGNLPDLQPPQNLVVNATGARERFTQYNLIWRPWCVTECDPQFSWNNLQGAIREMIFWPRSKLKELQKQLTIAHTNATEYLEELKSRRLVLPSFPTILHPEKELFVNNMTPYFDILEVMEYWVDLEKGGIKD